MSVVFAVAAAIAVAATTGRRVLGRARGPERYRAALGRSGLAVSLVDPNGSTSVLPFDLFARGQFNGTGPVVHDPRQPADRLRVFDFWWETVDAEGNRHRSWRTVAAAGVPCDAPYLVISPKTLTTALVSMVAGTDIEVESDEFNRMYYLRCHDRGFAMAVAGPELIDRCVQLGGSVSIEVHRGHLLVTTDRLDPEQFGPFHQLARDLRQALLPGLRDAEARRGARWNG